MKNQYTEADAKEWFDKSGIPFESFWLEQFQGFETISYRLEDGREFDLLVEIEGLNTALCNYLKKHNKVIVIDD